VLGKFDYIFHKLEDIKKQNLLRKIPFPFISYDVSHGTILVDGKEKDVFIFCSNDYLGMTKSKEVLEELEQGAKDFSSGSGASRLVCGNFLPHIEFEDFIREFFGLEKKGKDVLIFNSGWCANVGVISALCDQESEIFSDELNHASIIDGCRLSKAKISIFRHRDPNHLEDLLKMSRAKFKLVITDAVFSMDGDIAPLREISFLCEKYGSALYIDEAHAFGIFGEGGRGLSYELGVEPDIALFTLSKAVGVFGAFVIAPKDIIKFLISRARSFIFSTALPPFILSAAKKSIQIFSQNHELRQKVLENAFFLREELKRHNLDQFLPPNITTQITPFIIGDEVNTMKVSSLLFERGFFVQGIRPPSVPRGTSRLRITVTAKHTKTEISEFVKNLKDVILDLKVSHETET
jgi:8-amino-7-oxononanoate synthase